jgi:hypothetical protein
MAQRVENKDRRFGSADSYLHIQHEGIDYLFTDAEVEKAIERAQRNKEDLPVQGANLKGCFGIILAVVGFAVAAIGFMYLTK